MSLAENHVSAAYPLGGSSRRRRMLAIRVASQQAPPRLDPHPGVICSDTDSADALCRLCASSLPVTWLIVGDSFLPVETGTRDWPGFVELFTAGLRGRNRRSGDSVVNACTPDSRVQEVLDGFNDRIQRRNPSVVVLLCGAADSDGGMADLAEFEDAVLSMARRLEEAGALLVLNTSPVPHFTADDPLAAAHLVREQALRAIAAEFDLPLVDHRRDWDDFAIPPGLPGSWYDDSGRYLSPPGHRQIAQKLTSFVAGTHTSATGKLMSLVATSE